MYRYKIFEKENTNVDPALEAGANMFDAIWTAALALNETQLQLSKQNLSLKDFNYEDRYNISGTIYKEALKTKFFGLTVSVNQLATFMRVKSSSRNG